MTGQHSQVKTTTTGMSVEDSQDRLPVQDRTVRASIVKIKSDVNLFKIYIAETVFDINFGGLDG